MASEDSPRIGFCCKYVSPAGDAAEEKRLNLIGTTIAALGRLDRAAALAKAIGIVEHNVAALAAQIAEVGGRPPLERLLRVSSGVLPAYTHPVGRWMYRDEPAMRSLVESGLARAGSLARAKGVRLSMHPGQYCTLATTNPAALENAVADFEYHTDVMRMMGYGGGGWHPHGAHVNIHGGAKAAGIEGFRAGLARLSADARNLITVENDEVSYGLDDLLPLADALPIVLDIHHHWIKSGGEYIRPDDPRIPVIRDSWRGVRPVSHVSVSREGLLPGHPPDRRPDFAALLARGVKARDLRAHSDLMWNDAVNDLVTAHLVWTDFEVEAKHKNLASRQLAEHVGRRKGCLFELTGAAAARRAAKLDKGGAASDTAR
jgi:UV DNA damage repair endonuclease